MGHTRVEHDQISVALLTAQTGGDFDARRDLFVEHFGPTVDDQDVTLQVDSLVRLCAAFRQTLRDHSISALRVPQNRHGSALLRLLALRDAALLHDTDISPLEVARSDAYELAVVALDLCADLLHAAAAGAELSVEAFLQRLAWQLASEAAV